jgi:6-phospho-beta-glucosidase
MQIESGLPMPRPPSPWAELTGYDRIAFDVMHAVVTNSNAIIPLNVPNAGNIPELEPDDVIEVPCSVGANGPRALHVGALPGAIRALTLRVKHYERLTIGAALSRTHGDLVDALASNPLVPTTAVAATLVEELMLQCPT